MVCCAHASMSLTSFARPCAGCLQLDTYQQALTKISEKSLSMQVSTAATLQSFSQLCIEPQRMPRRMQAFPGHFPG